MPESTNNKDLRLDIALSNWQAMPIRQKPKLLKTFSSGLNHQTHLISSNDKQAVIKLFSKPSASAIEIQEFAAKHQLAPDILYTNQTDDIALMEYIETETLSQPITSQDLNLLGSTLKNLHSLPTELVTKQTGNFDLLDYYETYLADIDPRDSLTRAIHTEIQPIINVFLEDETPWCVCHNDLVKENCFITDASAQFIDWEYTQINNPWFDLATIIYSLSLNQQQTISLLEAYNANWLNKIEKPIYFASQCAMLWCDILWHMARGKNLQLPELKNKISDLQLIQNHFNRIH